MPPRTVGPWELLSVLGRGGIGTVYRARHRSGGRLAAIKVLGPSPAVDSTAARRLAREYEVLRRLDHPNVVRVIDAGVAEGFSYLAMELVEGLDLRTWLSPALDEGGPSVPPAGASPSQPSLTEPATPGAPGAEAIYALASLMDEPETEPSGMLPHDGPDVPGAPPAPRPTLDPTALEALNRPGRMARLRTVLAQVLEGLAYIHESGLVHRDLKPTNIMVDDQRRARLMDFGLVKDAHGEEEPLTQAGRVVGTYRYMSPEQAQGRPVDARSDLYSVGVILFELLCASPPFTARDPVQLWREILHVTAPRVESLNPGADRALAELTQRLLEKDPARRPQTAAAVIAALRG